MPIIKIRPLEGLKGLPEQEREAFKQKQISAGLLTKDSSDDDFDTLYRNGQFVKRFGLDSFMNNSPEVRNIMLDNALIGESWEQQYGNMPDVWKQKYYNLSNDAKLKLLNSDWLAPDEFEENWKQRADKSIEADDMTAAFRPAGSVLMPSTSLQYGEQAKQMAKERNDRVLEHIYNDDVDKNAKTLEDQVLNTHLGSEIADLSDSDVDKWFKRAVIPNSYTDQYGRPNAGIPEFAKFYVEDPTGGEEMQNMSIDDKREVLAMKKVYEENMDPEMARTALNNYAMRYNKERQSSWDKTQKWGKDVLISAVSYTADKINSVYNMGLFAADKLSDIGVLDKPEVWVDDQGNIVDENVSALTKDPQGRLVHQGEDGQMHFVHKEQIDRRTLHNMGKNLGVFGALGSEDESWLNPQDWNAREQAVTWSKDLAREYQKLGTSPYRVVYEPNDDSDLIYEGFKMASFGLADGAAQLIPFGIGMVGKALSTADKVGKATRAIGSAMNWSGKMLTAQSKFGQAAQGLAGAGGIAYAYQRGSFGETLQQNFANTEETALNRSKQEIYDEYQNNEEYKAQIDSQIDARAAAMKADYIKSLGAEGQNRIADEKALDEILHARAQDAVLGEEVQNRLNQFKGSEEYAALQNEAISSAGDAAWTTFWTESGKYAIVNTIGHRKWLYSNPTGIKNKVAAGLEGLREVTTPAGKQRLVAETGKFLTNGQKWKALGKTAGSQIWGGAWTNGTDDMMVDAAERINEDSFDRYLRAFEKGEAVADTYGFADGIYSYWKGLNNSLGQETTWNAATVGGLGSVLSFTPNMANIAHLATKEGRQMYKQNFMQKYQRNEDGSVKRDEKGNPLYEDVSWKNNWRDRANYFIQNGVLNTYYGAKQNERDLQQHADYVNMLLDDYDDFKVIEELVTSDIALDDAETVGDQKTMRFVKAINAMNALSKLAQNENDPTTLSSVVQNTKDFISKAAQMQMEGENAFTEEEMSNMLSQYYAQNPGIPQSKANNQTALYQISRNAQKLQEASEAMDKAEEQIVKLERSTGKTIDPAVRAKLKMNQALDGHWRERIQQMQQEIDDHASIEDEVSVENLIPAVGGRKNAEALIKVYDKQQEEVSKELQEQRQKTQDLKGKLDTAIANRKAAKTSDERYQTQKVQEDAQAEYDEALQQEDYLRGLIGRTQDKRNKVQEALNNQAQDESGKYQERVLTADEIFGLDAVSRARMLNPENRQLYSDAQQKEITKLEQRLLMRDADGLQKIQDIARLSQRIQQNQDAYSRMAQNPEAAAVALEAQRQQEADAAYKLINQRNAETLANFVNEFDDGMKGHDEIPQETKDQFVFRTLRKISPTLLDIIDEDNLLPQYYQQVQDAKQWGETVGDIQAVIQEAEESLEWKDNISKAIEGIVENAQNRNEILANLEKAIDDTDGSQTARDFEKVLNAMEQLGYQRDATTIETRKQRKEREAAERQRLENEKKQAEEDAKAAAEAAAKGSNVDGARLNDGEELTPDEDIPIKIDFGEDEKPAGKPAGTVADSSALEDNVILKPSYHSSMKGQIGGKQSKWDYYTENDKNTRETKDGKLILGVAFNGTLKPAIDYAVEAGVLGQEYKLSDDSVSMENSNKAREAVKALQDLGIETPKQLIEYVEQNEGKSTSRQNKEDDSFVNNNMREGHDDTLGDYVHGHSATLAEEAQSAEEGTVSNEIVDSEVVNDSVEESNENSFNTLSGNAMSEYEADALREHKLVHKKGKEPDDVMNKYYAWMKAAGIKLQNIIDDELPQIIAKNPHAKIKFACVRPDKNGTHDNDMVSHLLLVMDYDNSINQGITSIHNEDNGGVIGHEGKKYLIVGVAGYGNKNNKERQALYNVIYGGGYFHQLGMLQRGKVQYFKDRPSERFRILEDIETEVVPGSMTPGWIIRQNENDNAPQSRRVSELLADKERNPQGLAMNNLGWSIIEYTQNLDINADGEVMHPQNQDTNAGRVFVLIPAGNGKLLAAKIDALYYNDSKFNKGSTLYQELQNSLMQLIAPKYEDRYNALLDLFQKLYLTPEGHDILLSQDPDGTANAITLVRNGQKVHTIYTKAPDFSTQDFWDAIADWNPRINVTAKVLRDPKQLQKYDEAGALMTDLAKLGTAGVNYNVYGVDTEGNMVKPADLNWTPDRAESNSDYMDTHRTEVPYLHGVHYFYDSDTGRYSLNGVEVTDPETLKGLDYARRIIGLLPVKTEGVWDYYILSSGDVSEVIRQSNNTKRIEEVQGENAQKFIQEIEEKKAAEIREAAMREALGTPIETQEEGNLVVDEETGNLNMPPSSQSSEITSTASQATATTSPTSAQVGSDNTTKNFTQTMRGKNRTKIMTALKQKWPEAPFNSVRQLENYLKDKGVQLERIPTDDDGLNAWIRNDIICK